jgi:uncharacterized protein
MKLEPGGRPGGEVKFLIGAILAVCGAWLFFDSVHFMTGRGGLVSNAIGGGRGEGGMGETTSMGIVLVPLFTGVVALFFNVRQKWAWGLTGLGLLILGVEIVSRFRPVFSVKATHLFVMIALIGGGLGLMLRGYVEDRRRGID